MDVMIVSVTDDEGKRRVRKLLVHGQLACAGRSLPCCVHSPGDHHMRRWPMNWNDGVMGRICVHGIAHPDPDHLAYMFSVDPARAIEESEHVCCATRCCGQS